MILQAFLGTILVVLSIFLIVDKPQRVVVDIATISGEFKLITSFNSIKGAETTPVNGTILSFRDSTIIKLSNGYSYALEDSLMTIDGSFTFSVTQFTSSGQLSISRGERLIQIVSLKVLKEPYDLSLLNSLHLVERGSTLRDGLHFICRVNADTISLKSQDKTWFYEKTWNLNFNTCHFRLFKKIVNGKPKPHVKEHLFVNSDFKGNLDYRGWILKKETFNRSSSSIAKLDFSHNYVKKVR